MPVTENTEQKDMKGSQIKNLNQTGRYVSFNVCVCVFVCVNQCVDTIHVFFFCIQLLSV